MVWLFMEFGNDKTQEECKHMSEKKQCERLHFGGMNGIETLTGEIEIVPSQLPEDNTSPLYALEQG